jgi:hypothetical protein
MGNHSYQCSRGDPDHTERCQCIAVLQRAMRRGWQRWCKAWCARTLRADGLGRGCIQPAQVWTGAERLRGTRSRDASPSWLRCGPATPSWRGVRRGATHPWTSPFGPADGGSATLRRGRCERCSSGDFGTVSTTQQTIICGGCGRCTSGDVGTVASIQQLVPAIFVALRGRASDGRATRIACRRRASRGA